MRNLAVFGARGPTGFPGRAVEIDRLPVRSAILRTAAKRPDWSDPASARRVLVQVNAFSCNFRDKGLIARLRDVPSDRFFVIGSELAGTVVETGPDVSGLHVGDRVMTQHGFTGRGGETGSVPEGIPTNQASKEFQLLHEHQLVRIPEAMADELAAGFSLGAQTAYSMIRKLDPRTGARALVTSATSNTSLHLIAALRQRGVRLVASTTADGVADQLRQLGVDEVIRVGPGADSTVSEGIARVASELGGLDCVFDPFFDLHLEAAVAALAPFGKYTTCGLLGQTPGVAEHAGLRPMNAERIMIDVMVKNLTIVGNCLGLREDLERALADFSAGAMSALVDTVFTGEDAASFLDRSFNDRRRFGKVVFSYA